MSLLKKLQKELMQIIDTAVLAEGEGILKSLRKVITKLTLLICDNTFATAYRLKNELKQTLINMNNGILVSSKHHLLKTKLIEVINQAKYREPERFEDDDIAQAEISEQPNHQTDTTNVIPLNHHDKNESQAIHDVDNQKSGIQSNEVKLIVNKEQFIATIKQEFTFDEDLIEAFCHFVGLNDEVKLSQIAYVQYLQLVQDTILPLIDPTQIDETEIDALERKRELIISFSLHVRQHQDYPVWKLNKLLDNLFLSYLHNRSGLETFTQQQVPTRLLVADTKERILLEAGDKHHIAHIQQLRALRLQQRLRELSKICKQEIVPMESWLDRNVDSPASYFGHADLFQIVQSQQVIKSTTKF